MQTFNYYSPIFDGCLSSMRHWCRQRRHRNKSNSSSFKELMRIDCHHANTQTMSLWIKHDRNSEHMIKCQQGVWWWPHMSWVTGMSRSSLRKPERNRSILGRRSKIIKLRSNLKYCGVLRKAIRFLLLLCVFVSLFFFLEYPLRWEIVKDGKSDKIDDRLCLKLQANKNPGLDPMDHKASLTAAFILN